MCLHSVGSVSYVVMSIHKSSNSTELLSPKHLLHSRESVCLNSPVCNLSPIIFSEFCSYVTTFLKELK